MADTNGKCQSYQITKRKWKLPKLSNQEVKTKALGSLFYIFFLQTGMDMLLYIWEWFFTLVPKWYTMILSKLPIERHVLPLGRVPLMQSSAIAGGGIKDGRAVRSSTASGNTLEWRHNGRDSVSNNQPYDCLLNRLSSRRSKKTSKLRASLAFVRGSHRAKDQ